MGTHPIFESDFDCLTEMSDDSLNEPDVYHPETMGNYSYSAREAQTHELSEDQRLHNVNQKLLFKGYNSILGDSGSIATPSLIAVIERLLECDASLVQMIDDTREDVQRSEIEVKKYLQKSEMLSNENELKDRKIGQALQRESKLTKKNDDSERKLKEKTELARKLGVSLKNTEAKYKVEKRKLELEVDKLKEKMNQHSRSQMGKSFGKSRLTGHLNMKGEKEYNVSMLTRDTTTSATVLASLSDNNRTLIEINAQLKEALVGSYTKITQTMGTFPNYDEATEQRIIDLADINPGTLVGEVAKTCNQLKQVEELEADLAARQEKITVTQVAKIENEVAELKRVEADMSDEMLFRKMNELINDDDELPATPEHIKHQFEHDKRRSSSTPLQRFIVEKNSPPLVKPTILFEKNNKFEKDSFS